jgi:hypothetical protein
MTKIYRPHLIPKEDVARPFIKKASSFANLARQRGLE